MAETVLTKPKPETIQAPTKKNIAVVDDNLCDLFDDRKLFHITACDLFETVADSWNELQKQNNPPTFFNNAGLVTSIKTIETAPVINRVNRNELRYKLATIYKFVLVDPKGNTHEKYPPLPLVDAMLISDNPLPPLKKITYAPTFSRDGKLHTAEGYNPITKNYYFSDGLHIPEVPKIPTDKQLCDALDLFDDIVFDFPFKGDADKTNALALFLTPFVRDMCDRTPAALFKAPVPGAGKDLLAETLLYAGNAGNYNLLSPAKDDDEYRKRITATIPDGKDIIISNVETLDSSALAAAWTAGIWTDRILGTSNTTSIPVYNIFAITANNPIISAELTRRIFTVTLDPNTDKPWERENFRHKNLRQYVHDRRADLIFAALVMVQSWIAAGMPAPRKAKTLGSFERWSMVLGGITENLHMPDFNANRNEFYESADTESAAWRELVKQWYDKHKAAAIGTADILLIAEKIEGIPIHGNTDDSRKKSFGRQLAKKADRVFDVFKIVKAGTKEGSLQWKVLKQADNAQEVQPDIYEIDL